MMVNTKKWYVSLPLLALMSALIVLIGCMHKVSAADGLYTSVPKESDALHVLRIHDGNGNNTHFRFAIYTDEGANSPTTNPVFNFNSVRNSNCKSSSRNRISITNGSPSAISAVCPQNINIATTGGWAYDSNIGRYRKDIEMTLSGGSKSVANFRVTVLTGGFYIGYKANFSTDGYAVNALNSEPTYRIEFAGNPCIAGGPRQVGAWDVRDGVKIRLYDRNRDNSSGLNLLRERKNNSGDEATLSIDFTTNQSKKYYFDTDMNTDDDTVSMWWPEDTVYAGSAQCYRYTLTPSVGSIDPRYAAPGERITIPSRVTSDLIGRTPSISWRLIRVIDNQVVASSSRHFTGTGSHSLPDVYDQALYGRPIGTQVCYRLEVNPWTNRPSGANNYTWRASGLSCYTIAKKPHIQIIGGDLRAHGEIKTTYHQDNTNPRWFGSWVEYGAFASVANGQATGYQRIASGVPSNSQYAFNSSPSYGDYLTFANSPAGYGQGNFTLPPAADLSSNFPTTGSTVTTSCGSIDLTTPGRRDYVCGSSPITLSGTLGTGASVTVRTTGTITISSDINQPVGPYTNVKDIAQLVLMGNAIRIDRDVEKVDAWLIANDINTCYNPPGPLTVNRCDKQLTINGPIKTNTLHLYRTAGGEEGSFGKPAEILNLRADAYLWLYRYITTSSQRINTTYIQELPPRY